MKDKGHTYEYLDDKNSKKSSQPYEKEIILKEEILKAENIDHDEFNGLLSNQRNNTATREDKIKIERYLFMKEWGINYLDEEFMNRYYGKTHILNNLRYLTGNKNINAFIVNDELKDIMEYDKARKLEQITMIKEVLKELEFEIGGDKKLTREKFEVKIKNVTTKTQLFININKSQPLFGYNKTKILKLTTIKRFMGFINSLLYEWGVVIISDGQNKRNCNNKFDKLRSYTLNYVDNINEYL